MASTLQERIAQAASGNSAIAIDPLADDEGRAALLRLDDIEPDPNQPRKDFGNVEELAASIRTHGLLTPITVEPLDNRRFRIIAGERRYRASKLAGLTTIRAIIRTLEEQSRIEVQLIENLHRKDLNAIEEARVLHRLLNEFRLTQDSLAGRIGKSQPYINQSLRLLDLPAPMLADYQTSDKIPKSTLLAIAQERSAERQTALWERAKAGHLTVRQARGNLSHRAAPAPLSKAVFSTAHAASVIVQSTGPDLTAERIRDALAEALQKSQTGGRND